MAQADLYGILKAVNDQLSAKGSTIAARKDLDSAPHDLRISATDLIKEINIQLQDVKLMGSSSKSVIINSYGYNKDEGRTNRSDAIRALEDFGRGSGFTAAQSQIIKDLAEEYCTNVLEFIRKRAGKNYSVEIISGGGTEYTVRISKISDTKESVYNFLTKDKDAPLGVAKGILRNKLNNSFKKLGNVRENFELHLGHITGVAELQSMRAMSQVNLALESAGTTVIKDLMKLEVLSKFKQLGNPEFAKSFEFSGALLRPESAASNLTQSGYEKTQLTEVKNAIKAVVEANKDWANQRGSDSVIDALTKDLIKTIKSNTKVPVKTSVKNLSINAAPTSAKMERVVERKVRKLNNKVGQLGLNAPQPSLSIRALIPMLNQRLPEYVKANMGHQGRLNNRTGRFAESTEIVDIDGDYVTYSYMLSPYQVFESQGSRDPRPLIEMSIRQMALGIIKSKFSLRRV